MHVGPAARPRSAAQLALAAATTAAAATMSAASFGAAVLGPASALGAEAEQAATDARRSALRRPVRRVPTDLSPGRLKGSYVGVLGSETLVLTLAVPVGGALDAASADAVLVGTLNRNAREPVTLEVLLEGGRGLAQRPLPGLGVSFGAVLEDADGRLWIALVADDGRVAAELSEIKTKSGGK